jgi:hypothetical protein
MAFAVFDDPDIDVRDATTDRSVEGVLRESFHRGV